MQIVEVVDLNGRKHKIDLDAQAKVAADGQRLRIPMLLMDAEPGGGMFFCDTEQLKEQAMTMTADEAQKRSDDAYDAMVRDLDFKTRNKPVAGQSSDDP